MPAGGRRTARGGRAPRRPNRHMVRAPAPTPARRARIASGGCCITPHPPRPHSFSDTLALTIHSLILLLLIRLLILTVGILRPAHLLPTAAGVVSASSSEASPSIRWSASSPRAPSASVESHRRQQPTPVVASPSLALGEWWARSVDAQSRYQSPSMACGPPASSASCRRRRRAAARSPRSVETTAGPKPVSPPFPATRSMAVRATPAPTRTRLLPRAPPLAPARSVPPPVRVLRLRLRLRATLLV